MNNFTNDLKSVINQNKNLLLLVCLVCILVVFSACIITVLNAKTSKSTESKLVVANETKNVESEDGKITEITFTDSSLEMRVGEKINPSYTVNPSDADTSELIWKSTDENIAVVNNGIVTAVSEGTATITLSTKDKSISAELEITIIESNDQLVEPTGITLSANESYVNEGGTDKIIATVLPEDASNKVVTWSSSDTSIATVDNGTIKGIKSGTTTITATTSNGLTASLNVVVNNSIIPVESISLSKTNVSLTVGKTTTVTASISPSNATNKNVTWSSNNKSIATVTSNGTIKGIKAGTATITAYSSSGKSASVTVNVNAASSSSSGNNNTTPVADNSIHVTSVSFNNDTATLNPGDTITAQPTIKPSNATNKNLTWSSSNTSVATVSNGKITAVSIGTAVITAKANDNGISGTITVKVVKKTVNVSSVKLNTNAITLTDDETYQLEATVYPLDADLKDVTWKSSNEKLVTVNAAGKITVKSAGTGSTPGTVTITVTTKYGAKIDTATITVNQKITVVFHSNTGSTDKTIEEYIEYGDSKISSNFSSWTKSGYKMVGWSRKSDATEATYSGLNPSITNDFIINVYNKKFSEQTTAKKIDLYAVWEED